MDHCQLRDVEQRRVSAGTLVAYFALFDLLFLPQFPFLVMPYSLPLVVAVLVWTQRIEYSEEFVMCLVLGGTVLASAALSTFFTDTETSVTNAKRAGQFLAAFAYFFFFSWLGRRTALHVKGILLLFVAYYLMWAAYFVYSPYSAEAALLRLYPAIAPQVAGHLLFLRFALFFEDANTAAYFYLIVIGFLFASRSVKPMGAVLLTVAGLAGVLVTQSRGALLAFVLMLTIGLVVERRVVRAHAKWAGLAAVFVGVLGILFLGWINTSEQEPSYSALLAGLMSRRLLDVEGVSKGRPDHYIWAITHLLPMPLGRGYSLFAEGASFRPHSDHVRLLYSYGFIAYLAAIRVLFSRLFRSSSLVLPALMAFSINTLIDDTKLLGLFLSLLAILSAAGERKLDGATHVNAQAARTRAD